MTSIQNTITEPLTPLPSSQKKVTRDAGIEPTIMSKAAAPGADELALNNALTKADVLTQTLQTTTLNGERKDDRELATQQLKNSLNGVASRDIRISPEDKINLQDAFDQISPQIRALASPPPPTAQGKTVEDKVLWEKVANSIGQIDKEYLSIYETVVKLYTEFYMGFSDILSQMGNWISPGKDGNKVKLNVDALSAAVNGLKARYQLPSRWAVVYPPQFERASADNETVKKWAHELGMDEKFIKSDSGGYVLIMDMTPLENMSRDVAALGEGTVELDNAKFQAWQSGFKAQEERLKTTLQTLTQKYSNANSLYDNLVKILSSTISSCLETAKSFLHG